jgi:putative endonuclease
MIIMGEYCFYVYIITNWEKTVLYTGVTNNISRRLNEHFSETKPGFTRQYSCKFLIFYEQYQYINDAIRREKEIKGWRREKKEKLINSFNPDWIFLNERFMRMKL